MIVAHLGTTGEGRRSTKEGQIIITENPSCMGGLTLALAIVTWRLVPIKYITHRHYISLVLDLQDQCVLAIVMYSTSAEILLLVKIVYVII